jgi:Thioredoxin
MFAAESEKWTNVVFLKVNVDRMRQTAAGIRGIPTFRFYQNQRELETISGQDFRPLLTKYAGAPGGGSSASSADGSTASFVGTARRLGSGGGGAGRGSAQRGLQ